MHPLAVMVRSLEFQPSSHYAEYAEPFTTVRAPKGAHFVNHGSELHVTQAWQWLPFENEFPDWVFEDLSST
jgi:hypothetical protein